MIHKLKKYRIGIGSLFLSMILVAALFQCTTPGGNPPTPCNCPDTTVVVNPPMDTSIGTSVLFGVNVNHYNPKEKQEQVNGVRWYFPIGWGFTEFGYYGSPMKQGQKQFFGMDEYLAFMKSKNVDVLLCLMQSPDWLNGHNSGVNTNDFPPVRPGMSREDPASYREIAGIYGAFAKRYGRKVWAPGSYKIDPAPPRWTNDGPQQHASALNYVTDIECRNEPDMWWKKGTPEYITAKEYAVFLIAVYDSIKAADPTMRVIMAGLTNYDLTYLTEMKAECDRRGRKFPSDAINVHHYSNNFNVAGVHPPTWKPGEGCAPELDKDMASLAKIVAFAKSIGLPVWVTEYGYDTAVPTSVMAPKTFTNQTTETLQAEWNVRSALEHVRLGAVRSYVYAMVDQNDVNAYGGQFQSSGLLRGEPLGQTEKPGFVRWVWFSKEIKGFNYMTDESTSKTRIMKFRHPDGRIKFAFWSPTASNTTFQASVNGTNVTVTEFVQFLNVEHSGLFYQ